LNEIIKNIDLLKNKHELFKGMIGKTLKGNHIQNVMNYKNLDAEKYLKK
jgi:hypothetical protein